MSGQGPVERGGAHSFLKKAASDDSTRSARSSTQQPADCLGAASSLFNKVTNELSGAVSSPIAGPLAAWMPPSSPHGWVHGVSRKR
ncbi:hypothetical protein BVV10_18690 [Xanthomonas oryzae pv. oryzae]|nr:hypothetical protein BVV16_18660 [Xanthomonas oryzae pv. oryzae]AUI95372.1 hypothetical protein BVV17_18690 [Xanthomonas oryzae pv. oryzae]AUJ02721.1 hypothetical protein BVV10_18690 [Xanthomonas oryzae pv. oryzae]AUJ06388.1 hypothetical protein BVV19_18725 [Xanthomonas oryzae pv. oryzae]AUJ10064.1 hypothetical protein BVV09_18690 [Xanthomonas oryzae pv. oryzae]